MKKLSTTVVYTILFLTVGLLFTKCEQNYDIIQGSIKINLSDAPFDTDLILEANVTIDKIEIRNMDGMDEGSYLTIFDSTLSYNLLELTNGNTANLVDAKINSGTYDQLRVYLSEASVLLVDSTIHDLKTPSAAQSGIKVNINPPILLSGKEDVELLLDFDLSKSFVMKGNASNIVGFNFKPVIRVANLSTCGILKGEVKDTSNQAISGAQVTLIKADTVYTTTFSNENGFYQILGIDVGKYDVNFEKQGYDSLLVEDITIDAGKTTTQDAVLIPN